jgi:hypothetical protein
LQQEVVSLQRILNQSQNPKSKDQTLKKIQDFQTRLNTNINKSSPKSFEQLALIKMKEVLDGVTYNKLEQGFVNEDKEMLDQLQDATGLYNNLPLVISKLRNTLPQDQFVQVNSLLKDGVLTKVFSGDNNNQANY